MSDFLSVGDRIVLFDDGTDGHVGSINPAHPVGVRPKDHKIHSRIIVAEAVFLIRQQHNYKFTQALQDFLENNGLKEEDAQQVPGFLDKCKARNQE